MPQANRPCSYRLAFLILSAGPIHRLTPPPAGRQAWSVPAVHNTQSGSLSPRTAPKLTVARGNQLYRKHLTKYAHFREYECCATNAMACHPSAWQLESKSGGRPREKLPPLRVCVSVFGVKCSPDRRLTSTDKLIDSRLLKH